MSPGLEMYGSYDYRLVVLSILIAVLASYTGLDLAGRINSSQGRARFLWLSCGAITMGIGIWSMHYVGMLAYRLPVPVLYDWPMVLLSLGAAVFASAVSLFVASRRQMGAFRVLAGSISMGGGIAAMHYIGMAAMRLPAMHHYSPGLVALSMILAIAISFVALRLTYRLRTETAAPPVQKAISAMVMGAAIPVMHYTGMAAASFTPSAMPIDTLHAVTVTSFGAVGIVVVTFMVLGFTLVTSFADRRISLQVAELASSGQRYRRIVETAFDAFVGVDSSGLINDWNEQAEVTFGWERSAAIGQDLSRMIVPVRDPKDGKARPWREILASEESALLKTRIETMAMHRDQHEFPVELTISALRAGNKNLFAVFIHDVTDRRRTEDEREKAKEAAEAGSRAKSDFLGNMSHEIRTPLNGVIGMTDLVLETELTTEQREYLHTVKLSADALLSVINDILDFSKIETGKIDLELNDFNLRSFLDITLKPLIPLAEKKGLEFSCEIEANVPEFVRGDSSRLRQVLINLLGNAIKFTHQGDIALNVCVADDGAEKRILHFSVSDSGVGIPAEKLELIFHPFSQADNSTTRKYGGTGLGLTISARLVQIMGGRIWVESEVQRGTRFHFTAQLEAAEKSLEVSKSNVREVLQGVKALIVDDNVTNRKILEGMLKRWEMSATSVSDGEAALACLASGMNSGRPYAVILTDMNMPKMDGFELIVRIRARPEFSEIPIMVLTSAGNRGDGARCLDLGVAAYLLKPIRHSELREAIARSLGDGQNGPMPLITRYSLQQARDPASLLRVLVAEDIPVNQLLATRILEKRGHRVVMASNGREALAALEKDRFDLVLMNMRMPEMDGFEATALLREKERRKGDGIRQPVVALTACGPNDDRDRCRVVGVDDYLANPIQPLELDALLETYVERRLAAANAAAK